MNIKSKNIEWIDAAKGCCILMVVFFHVTLRSYHIPLLDSTHGLIFTSAKIHDQMMSVLAPLRMPLFFFLSGFLVRRSITQGEWEEVLSKRVLNIFYLFFLWSFIQWGFFKIIHYFLETPQVELYGRLLSKNILDYFNITLSGGNNIWYLYALPFYFLLSKITVSKKIVGLAIFIIMHIFAKIFIPVWPSFSILQLGIYFWIGCFWGSGIIDVLSSFNKKSLYLIAVSAVSAIIFYVFGDKRGAGVSFLFVALMILSFSFLIKRFDMLFLRWLGKNTLQIYVIHLILLEFVCEYVIELIQSHGYFENQLFSIGWWVLYPSIATLTISIACIIIWRLTGFGVGRYLYQAPWLLARDKNPPIGAAFEKKIY